MKVIITKYATTSGIRVIDAETFLDAPKLIRESSPSGVVKAYYHGNDWHADKASARADIQARFDRKRASLNKQFDALVDKISRAMDAIDKAEL